MLYKRWTHLTIGLILYAVGIVFTINANMGLALLLITYQLNEAIGFGTLANIVVIGLLIDLIFYLNLIPVVDHMITGTAMLFVGMELIALGSFFYIGSSFGTGPRDGLMMQFCKNDI